MTRDIMPSPSMPLLVNVPKIDRAETHGNSEPSVTIIAPAKTM